MTNITVLFKTRKDSNYRWHYACKCNDCGESLEVRSDRLTSTVHKCKPKEEVIKPVQPKVVKEVRYKSREIINGHTRTMKLIANNKAEMKRLVTELEQTYVILK